MSAREFDLVLWGATGYTGRLVAEYLVSTPSAQGLRWAIAGRDHEKLQRLQEKLTGELPIVLADAHDEASLNELTRRTRVVCTAVGPYALHGSEQLVAACVRNRTHYCDITGEVPWIRQSIDRNHETARAAGTRIVHCCGFDSVPSDLGVLMLHEAMRARGRGLSRVDAFFEKSRGHVSGGTLSSLIGVVEAMRREPAVRALMLDPYALDPEPGCSGPDRSDGMGIRYEPRLGRWVAPFVMAAINTRVVRRSNAVAGYPYGRDFRYTEQMSAPAGLKGLAVASAVAAGTAGLLAAVRSRRLRGLVERRLPRPGGGPTAQERAAGYLVLRLLGEAAGDGPPLRLLGRVEDRRDPGYGMTAVTLGESALCLARDDLGRPGGVLTPATAMGVRLVERLRKAGMRWEVTESARAPRRYSPRLGSPAGSWLESLPPAYEALGVGTAGVEALLTRRATSGRSARSVGQ
jgi:short subunit dehydrogenase-like uncharacterized protein